MGKLYFCEVGLKSLADLEKFEIITYGRVRCKNVPEIDAENIIKDIKVFGNVFVKAVVDYDDLTELKKWFCVRYTREAVCVDGTLYVYVK